MRRVFSESTKNPQLCNDSAENSEHESPMPMPSSSKRNAATIAEDTHAAYLQLGDIYKPIQKTVSMLIGIDANLGEPFVVRIKAFLQEITLDANNVHATLGAEKVTTIVPKRIRNQSERYVKSLLNSNDKRTYRLPVLHKKGRPRKVNKD